MILGKRLFGLVLARRSKVNSNLKQYTKKIVLVISVGTFLSFFFFVVEDKMGTLKLNFQS